MTPEQIQLFTDITGYGLAAFLGFLFVKFLSPVLKLLVDIARKKLAEKSIEESLTPKLQDSVEKKLMFQFEGNHFSDFYRRIDALEKKCEKIEGGQEDIKLELMRIKTLMEK